MAVECVCSKSEPKISIGIEDANNKHKKKASTCTTVPRDGDDAVR